MKVWIIGANFLAIFMMSTKVTFFKLRFSDHDDGQPHGFQMLPLRRRVNNTNMLMHEGKKKILQSVVVLD